MATAKLHRDDAPDLLDPVRRMIDAGAKFRQIRWKFADSRQAFDYYAARQHALHLTPTPPHACCMCGGACDLTTVEATWHATVRGALDWVIVPLSALSLAGTRHLGGWFHTRHAACERCVARWRRRRIAWMIVAALGVVILTLGAVPAIMGLLLGYGGTWKPSERPQVILTGWLGLLGGAAGLTMVVWARTMSAPPRLRHIGSWPIQLEFFEMLMPWDESQPDWILLTEKPLPVQDAIQGAYADDAGGIDIFLGTTRSEINGAGQQLLALDYEAYPEMAVKQMHDLARRAREQWPIKRLAILHRIGRVEVAEPSVAIVVACGHRDEAFEACRWIIDMLKKDVAIWKKEVWADGTGTWVHPEPIPKT